MDGVLILVAVVVSVTQLGLTFSMKMLQQDAGSQISAL